MTSHIPPLQHLPTPPAPAEAVLSAPSGSVGRHTWRSGRRNSESGCSSGKLSPRDTFAFSAFLAQSAVYGSGATPVSSLRSPQQRVALASVASTSPRRHDDAPELAGLKDARPRIPGGKPGSGRPKRKLGVLIDSLSPQALTYVHNTLVPQAVEETLERLGSGSEDPPRDWRRHIAADRARAATSRAAEARHRVQDFDITFFTKSEDGKCRGREYASRHAPNLRGIEDANRQMAGTLREGGDSASLVHHHPHRREAPLDARDAGKSINALAPRDHIDSEEGVYYTSTSDDEDRGEFAEQRKAEAAARGKRRQRELAGASATLRRGTAGRAVPSLPDPARSAAASAAGVAISSMRTAPTGCGACDFVASTLDHFDARSTSSPKSGGHLTRLTRSRPADHYGGDASAAQQGMQRMRLLVSVAPSAMAAAPPVLHFLMRYHSALSLLMTLTPRCLFAFHQAMRRRFAADLDLGRLTTRARSDQLTLREFLEALLSPPPLPRDSAALGEPIDNPDCVILETADRRFHLPHRPLYPAQHTTQLGSSGGGGGGGADALGRVRGLRPVPAGNASVEVSRAVEKVLEWEDLFVTHDPEHTGVVDRQLFLFNVMAASSDASVGARSSDEYAATTLEERTFGEAISWSAPPKVATAGTVQRPPDENDRVRYAVGWVVALLRLRGDGDTVRPAELFAIRDLLTAEVRQYCSHMALSMGRQPGATASTLSSVFRRNKSSVASQQQPSRSSTPRRHSQKGPNPQQRAAPRTARSITTALICFDEALSQSAGLSPRSASARAASLVHFSGPVERYLSGLESFTDAAQKMLTDGEMPLAVAGALCELLCRAFLDSM